MLGSSTLTAKDSSAVYTGTLGNQAVVMAIGTGDDGNLDGRYFYARHHRDIPLSGSKGEPDHLQLLEGTDGDDATRPQLDLQRQADGSLLGQWSSAKGKTLKLVLQPAHVPAPAADADPYLKRLYGTDLYEYLRLSGLKLQQGQRQTFMGHTLQWWIEPDSKITLFQILDGYPDDQRQRINQVLHDRLWSEVSSFHECMLGAHRYGGGDYEQTVTPRLLSAHVLSISVDTSYDCGGAHPDFGDAPINLDARTALSLTLEDVLWLGPGQPFHYAEDTTLEGVGLGNSASNNVSFEVFSGYREKSFAPWLAGQLAALYPAQVKDDGCGYGAAEVWQFPAWYLTPKGIDFTPFFDRADRACEANDDWSVLPYRIVAKHPGKLHLDLP